MLGEWQQTLARLQTRARDLEPQAAAARTQLAMLPLPGRQQLAVLAPATECVRDWDDYIDIMGGVTHSLRFTEPETTPRGDIDMITAALAGFAGGER